MIIQEHSQQDVAEMLSKGLTIKVGPFLFSIRSQLPQISRHLHYLYADYELVNNAKFSDFPIEITASGYPEKWYSPKVYFSFDGHKPFTPLPLNQSTAMLEWAMNWCISTHAHQYLILHSAVVSKNGKALILPGAPGSGKSTLCAALVNNGWKLLSDELTLINIKDGKITPVPKPIGLKNESITIIKSLMPDSRMGVLCHDTSKGTVTHVAAPPESVLSSHNCAIPLLVVFPRYNAESTNLLSRITKGITYMTLVENAFNYHLLGKTGFETLTQLVDRVDGFEFIYNDMNAALTTLQELVE